ncbi:MAG: tRNA (guanosine(46)-N7)-methyltransferase TrmB [Sphingobacteriales bacterium]|nr:MAG: tRNA (guanosine(46)-N7)-methyltransferase TrmB [Sphingobacteriales bacterium]
MAQKKLLRFAQIKEMLHVLEYPENMQGEWSSFFKNDNPLIIELACGRGEYTIGMAAMFPGKNFIGVDVKGNRIYIGAKKAQDSKLDNAAFLRTQIEIINSYFGKAEVDEIWITFPDPQLRTSKAKKRLTHPRFLRLYQQFLKPGGSIHLKTDSPALHIFTSKVIDMYGLNLQEESGNVYAEPHAPELDIKTHYEGLDIAQSKKIHYLRFSLPDNIADKDDELMEYLKQTENNNEQA